MAKYDPLRDFLRSRQLDQVVMTFAEVADLVGGLPDSARQHRVWWANDSKVQAQAWRSAGWHVRTVDQTAQRVTFARGQVGGSFKDRQAQQASQTSSTSPSSPTSHAPKPAAAVPVLPPVEADTTETAVQAAVVTHLAGDGWQILRVAHTDSREHGTDILARKNGRVLAVEVKGYPSRTYAGADRSGETKPTQPSTQARHWYGQALLKAMLTRDEHPEFDVAVAFPDMPTYRNLRDRTKTSLTKLGIIVFFVDPQGNVSTAN